MRVKQVVRSVQIIISEQCERTNEHTSKWPITRGDFMVILPGVYVCVCVCACVCGCACLFFCVCMSLVVYVYVFVCLVVC